MIPRLFAFVCVLLGLAVVLVADESSVQVDPTIDFSVLRTFSLRAQQVQSRREELDNPLFLKKLATAIRHGLIAKGLTETRERPDLLVDFTITGADFSNVERRLVRGIPGGPVAVRRPIRIAEGTLVIDVFRRDDQQERRPGVPVDREERRQGVPVDREERRQGVPVDRDPVWRGVYRDDERTGSKLTRKLPEDAKQLIAKYPKVR